VSEGRAAGASLYEIDAPALARLRPDLVLTQSVCGVCAVDLPEVERAVRGMSPRPRVLSLDPSSLEDVLEDVRRVGEAAGADGAASRVLAELRTRVRAVAGRREGSGRRPRTVFLEWLDPPMVGGHWIPRMIDLAGGRDALGRAGEPSRFVAWDEVLRADPEALLLGPCGFDLARARREVDLVRSRPGFDSLEAVRSDRVFLVDGNAHFSRPGPRLVDGLEILGAILHPESSPARAPEGAFERL
jgi:iron complex transport system substrate-binding protein